MRCKKILSVATAVAICLPFALCGCGGISASPDIEPHISPAQTAHTVPIDSFEPQQLPEIEGELTVAQYRDRVDTLYSTVVYDKRKPVFCENDPVEPIYNAAHDILSCYIHDEWAADEYQVNVVHTIHDWLIYNTDYDFALYSSYQNGNTDLGDDPAFYIDGVFLNATAVCDGLSLAFNFLCAMEDLDSVRVTGSLSSTPHAWNKVKVNGCWYNVDVTADSVYYSVGESSYKQIAHGYMLISDSTLKEFAPGGHDFSDSPIEAPQDYDYFADEYVEIGGKTYSRVVKSQAELNTIFLAISDQKGGIGKIELKLDFDSKTQVNSADMYFSEINNAYSNVRNPSFAISSDNKPYFRYPNGVYMFLIYK